MSTDTKNIDAVVTLIALYDACKQKAVQLGKQQQFIVWFDKLDDNEKVFLDWYLKCQQCARADASVLLTRVIH